MNSAKTIVLGTVIGTLAFGGSVWAQQKDAPKPTPTPAQPPAQDVQQPPKFSPTNAGGPSAQPVQNLTPEQLATAPKLVFAEMQHDFGRIVDEGMVETRFNFKNEGKGVLHFTTPFRASCGCTAGNPRSDKNPDVDQVDFQPGESGFIKVSFNAQGKHGDVNQQVTVVSNDPVSPEQIVKIHAFVRQTVAFDPPLVSFGEVQVGTPATQVVRVTGPAPAFEATYASISKAKYFNVKVVDTKPLEVDGEKMNQSTLEITYNGNAPRGTLSALTLIRTTSEKYPLKDLQVTAEVVGDIQVLPPRLNVGILDTNVPFTKIFRVSSRTGKPFKIVSHQENSMMGTPITVTVTPTEPGNETAYQVEVKSTSPATVAPISATISLMTDSPTDPKIDVMLSGAVRSPQAPLPANEHFTPGAPAGLSTPAVPKAPDADMSKPATPAGDKPAEKPADKPH
jgi:hypothetical protein